MVSNDGWIDAEEQVSPDAGWQDATPDMQGEKLPSYANGATAQTAINESPISYEDRLKLSVGNMSGKIQFLKDNYGEVQRTKSGDLSVKVNNVWHRVDPETFSMSDPWKMTKEIVGDVADLAPKILGGGAQVGAAILTGGASIPAQIAASGAVGAAGKGVESVLGRLVGTYQATDEEMLKDIALEGLINAGGATVALGIKPTASFIADKLKVTGKMLAELPEQSKEVITNMYGNVLGKGGARSVNMLADNTSEVTTAIKELAATGNPELAFKQRAVNLIKGAAEQVDTATSNFYGAGKREILNIIPENFTSKQPEVLKNIIGFFDEKGLVEAGKLKARDKVIADMSQKGISSEWAANPEAFKIVSNLWKSVQDFNGIPSVHGKQGAENLFKMRSALMALQETNATLAEKQGLSVAQTFLGQFGERVQNAIIPIFNTETPIMSKVLGKNSTNLLADLNSSYAGLKNILKPLANTNVSSKTLGDQAYEYAIDNITSQAGRKATVKTAFDTAMDVLAKYGSEEGKKASSNYARLMVYDAAKDFSGWVKPGLISTTATLGVPGALLAGSPAGAIAMGSTALLSSPRVGAAAISSGIAAKDMVKSFMASNAMMRGLTPAARLLLFKTPEAVTNMASTIYSAPAIRDGVNRKLMSEAFNSYTGQGKK